MKKATCNILKKDNGEFIGFYSWKGLWFLKEGILATDVIILVQKHLGPLGATTITFNHCF